MRGCLTFLLLVVAIVLVAAWFVLPPVAGAAVAAGLVAAGFNGTDTRVTVTADPPLELATAHADQVHVTSSNASFRQVTMSTVDVTFTDVQLLDRTAGGVSGTMTGLRITTAGGGTTRVGTARLSGSGSDVRVALELSSADAIALATSAVRAAVGAAPSKVTLTSPDRVQLVVRGLSVGGRLAIDADGGLVFRPASTTGPFSSPVDLIRPGPAVPIRLRNVLVGRGGTVNLSGAIDPSSIGG